MGWDIYSNLCVYGVYGVYRYVGIG